MSHFQMDKTQVGIIQNKSEWEDLNPLYSPLESLAIVEFLRQQYITLFNLSPKMDKTVVGFRKPKRKRKKYVKP